MDAPHLEKSAVSPASCTSAAAVEALYAMGHSLYTGERWADAAAVFRIMLRLVPEDERSWLALGECHERAGHKGVALELYSAAVAAVPGAKLCGLARFRLLWDLDRISEADDAFDTARSLAEASDDAPFLAVLDAERRVRP